MPTTVRTHSKTPKIFHPPGRFPPRSLAGLGEIEKKMPKGTVPGVRIRTLKDVESDWMASGAGGVESGFISRTPTKSEISLLIIPAMQELGFELVGTPKYIVDENPIWLWRSNISRCKIPNVEDSPKYELYVGLGPFKGLVGPCMWGPPNIGDTVKYGPKALVEWTAVFRSTDLESLSSKIGRVREIERHVHRDLLLTAGHGGEGGPTRKDFAAEVVAIPPKKKKVNAGTIGAIIGVALTIFSLSAKT